MKLFPLTLAGSRVRLEPLSLEHVDALAAIGAGPRETFGLTNVPAARAMRAYVELALAGAANAEFVPFVTVDLARGQVVGATRFGNLERWAWPAPPADPRPAGLDAVEIGWTWLSPLAQRSAVNTEAKWLMLCHAFEVWRVRRLTLRTDARNARSRAAIERIGARFDGILRAHMPAWDGGLRDTACFSILEPEWPAVKSALSARLSRGSA